MLDEHDFAFATWWTALPRLAKDIPVSWIPFDLAGEVIRSGLDKFEVRFMRMLSAPLKDLIA